MHAGLMFSVSLEQELLITQQVFRITHTKLLLSYAPLIVGKASAKLCNESKLQ